MKFGNYIILGFLLSLVCLFAGCEALQVYTGQDGQPHTQLTDAIGTAGQVIGAVGGFIPGYGLLASGISALLGVIGSGILAFMVKSRGNKINTAEGIIQTLIQGVNISAEKYNDLKASVLAVAKGINEETYRKVETIFVNFEKGGNTIKDVIKELSDILGTNVAVHTAVKTFENKV